jgi:hypothetical protein
VLSSSHETKEKAMMPSPTRVDNIFFRNVVWFFIMV